MEAADLQYTHGPLARVAARKSPLRIPDLAVENDYLKIPAVADLVKLGGIRTMLIEFATTGATAISTRHDK